MPLFSKLAGHLEKLAGDEGIVRAGPRPKSSRKAPGAGAAPGARQGDAPGTRGEGSGSAAPQAQRTSPSRTTGTPAKGPGREAAARLQAVLASGRLSVRSGRAPRARSLSMSLMDAVDVDADERASGARRPVRRNSISGAHPDSPNPSTRGMLTPLPLRGKQELSSGEEELLARLKAACQARDDAALQQALDAYLALGQDARSVAGFNRLLQTLQGASGSVPHMLRVYEEMRARGPAPNQQTFSTLIDAVCTRDLELGAAERSKEERQREQDECLRTALHLAREAHGVHVLLPTVGTYNQLLACCALAGRAGEAVQALALLEENVLITKDADSYRLLVEVFANSTAPAYEDEPAAERQARGLKACKRVFETFERVSGAMARIQPGSDAFSPARCECVWLAMLDAHFTLGDAAGAVALFERLLAARPYPTGALPIDEDVATTMVLGFVRAGDVRGAVQWLHQLHASALAQPSGHALEAVVAAAMQQQPADAAHLLCPVASALVVRDPLPMGAAAKCVQHLAGVLEKRKVWKQLPPADMSACLGSLQALTARVFGAYADAPRPLKSKGQTLPIAAVLRLVGQLTFAGRAVDAAAFFRLAVPVLRLADTTAPGCVSLMCDACHLPMAIADAALHAPSSLSDACVRFRALATLVAPAMRGMQGALLDAYHASITRLYEAASRDLGGDLRALALDDAAWQRVVDAFAATEGAAPLGDGPSASAGLGKLLTELARLPTDAGAPVRRPALDVARLYTFLDARYGAPGVALLQPWLAPDAPRAAPAAPRAHAAREASADGSASAARAAAAAAASAAAAAPAYMDGAVCARLPPVRGLDASLGSALQGLARAHGQLQADELYARLQASVARGVYASPGAIAVLINAFGRLSHVSRIDELYAMGMHVLASRPQEREWRTSHWVQLEDGMVTALSHASLGDRANTHRERLIAAGHVPSASAYAALIATIQERTDDAVVAEELFTESQRLGVRPTTYLYNTVISKLSRARKAEQALRLFDAMRGAGLRPSSVTYGAAINACVRTGDEVRATQLFAEMEAQPSFQPRVPPYNTMIQYYVHSCMDRDKALRYYEKMQQAGVRPSAHTYKLLLDIWGSIAPVQPDRQQAVFARLVADRLVGVQGTHWASLLHTQGTVLHDLDRALETFESIAEHAPGPRNSVSTVPDAVVYESLFSVFVAHGRTDLMPAYLARMTQQGILPTAYIANLLIKGYAQDGPLGLVEARRVFEAMIDPPAGIAAAGNHLPRHHGAGALGLHRERVAHGSRGHSVDRTNVLGALVNREPSTYEAMIRAELSFGNQDRALALFERMKARAFPAALVNRARAMFDHVGPRAAAA
ncbi:hypothetical protein MOBT1_001869 [Malassezia obtusa]|uniref:PROP1-like PPR domain-containing protein n=1 Tax=Malassezia obtusa TaxID=76774 RepID=A0AAF0E0X6_9BASI|nr:hypothetical protein MOBT1_001869 [Malassezia obtusa]